MKLHPLSSLLLPFLTSSAAAHHAHVYSSSASTQQWTDSIPFSTLRSVLAQRLGVSQYHSLDADDVSIAALNALQDSQKTLFAGDRQHDAPSSPRRQVVLVMEDVENVDGILPETERDLSSFTMADPPRTKATTRFLQDLGEQYNATHADADLACPALDNFWKGYYFETIEWEHRADSGCLTLLHGKISQEVRHYGTGYIDRRDAGRMVLEDALAASRRANADFIGVFVEPAPAPSFFKRATTSPSSWGAYTLPARSAQKKPDVPPAADDDDGDKDADPAPAPPADETPPRGILPQCFASQTACDDATHRCSGHGACALRYDLSGSDGRRQDGAGGGKCWACACTASVATTPGGLNRTTRWAGPACQKQDVSESFWLLGGATLALVSVAGWAVGLLVRMGNEDLPSVIGAGVAGPRAK